MSLASRDDLPTAPDDRSYVIRQYRMPAKVMHWVTALLVFAMFGSGVIAKQFGGGPLANLLMSLHKLTGALTLALIVARLIYRTTRSMPEWRLQAHRRPVLHWSLYGVAVLVPLLGWAGIFRTLARARCSRAIRCLRYAGGGGL